MSVNTNILPKEILPSQAFEVLKNEKNSFLVDVRTLPEWSFAGVPDLSSVNKNVIKNSWMFYPRMELNNEFALQIENQIPDKKAKIFFMCKVGGRSFDAAKLMLNACYENCYNITYGFEGEHDEVGRRGRKSGWKAEGLPWVQS